MTARALQIPRSETWMEHAPCAGQWWLTDPMQNAYMVRHDVYVLACEPGLRLCRTCPFVQACIDRVRPHQSWFDGVCGGRVWRGGKAVYTLKEVAA